MNAATSENAAVRDMSDSFSVEEMMVPGALKGRRRGPAVIRWGWGDRTPHGRRVSCMQRAEQGRDQA
jgi:hypothetical protein